MPTFEQEVATRRAHAAQVLQTLQGRLNAAATKAGLAAGYTVAHHSDQTDGYADYVGWTVEGPDVERAQKWLVANTLQEHKGSLRCSGVTTRYAEVRTSGGTTYVCTYRFSLGD